MSGIFDQIINYSPPLIVSGTVNYKGTWNASTNNPPLSNPPVASTKGDYYVVSTAGTQFSISFAVGDWIISSGTAWEKVDLTDAVSSVFGRTGAVVGVSTDYSAVGLTNTAIGAANPSTGAFTTISATTPIAVASGGTGVSTSTGTTNVVLSNSPTLVTPILGTPQSGTLTSCTGLPISTGVSGLGTGVATALAVNVGSAGAPVVNGGALGTPSGGTVTNLTGTASININGTVGATTPSTVAATTGTFSGSVRVSGPITNAAANSVLFAHNGTDAQVWALGPNVSTQGQLVIVPARSDATSAAVAATFNASGGNGAWGATTPSTGAFTTLSATGLVSITGGTLSQLQSQAGSVYFEQINTNTGAGAGVQIFQYNSGAGAGGDASIRQFTGAQNWIFGIDNSDGDKWKVSASDTLGTSDVLAVSTTGLAVTGALSVTGDVTLTATSSLIANKSVHLSDGAAGTATGAIFFINDTDTGFYRAGANTIGFMGNGASLGTWSPNGLAVNGTLSSTTGSSANAVEFHLNNTNASARDWVLLSTGSSWAGGGQTGYFNIYDNTAGQQRLTIDSSGNVGIGTASPGSKLDVNGEIRIGNTVNTVTATLPNRTITMVIGGTTYYIHAKTTND